MSVYGGFWQKLTQFLLRYGSDLRRMVLYVHGRCFSCRGMFLGTTLNGEGCTVDASVAKLARGMLLGTTQN